MKKCYLQSLAFASFLVLPVFGQSAETQQASPAFPIVELDQIRIVNYPAKHVQAMDLFRAAQNTVGRTIRVKERGRSDAPILDLSLLENAIVIFDTEEYGRKIIEMLNILDVPQNSVASDSGQKYVITEYTPRNVSARTIRDALKAFEVKNCDELDNRSLAIRVRADRMAEMQAFIARLDVPEPQLNITCYLLTGGEVPEGARAGSGFTPPSELIADLNAILPELEFKTLGFAMVQSAVLPGRRVSLSINTPLNGRYELGFAPVAYDAANGNMPVADCTVQRHKDVTHFDGSTVSKVENLLRTDTVFRGSQYTVLGASGVSPVFVVVHIRPVR